MEDCFFCGLISGSLPCMNLLNASGKSAGQSVPHFHIHLIPRRSNDAIDAWPHFQGAAHDVRDLFREISMEGE